MSSWNLLSKFRKSKDGDIESSTIKDKVRKSRTREKIRNHRIKDDESSWSWVTIIVIVIVIILIIAAFIWWFTSGPEETEPVPQGNDIYDTTNDPVNIVSTDYETASSFSFD